MKKSIAKISIFWHHVILMKFQHNTLKLIDSETISEQDFLKVLCWHDWFYSFSDDGRVYDYGFGESRFIEEAIKGREECRKIYTDFMEKRRKM